MCFTPLSVQSGLRVSLWDDRMQVSVKTPIRCHINWVSHPQQRPSPGTIIHLWMGGLLLNRNPVQPEESQVPSYLEAGLFEEFPHANLNLNTYTIFMWHLLLHIMTIMSLRDIQSAFLFKIFDLMIHLEWIQTGRLVCEMLYPSQIIHACYHAVSPSWCSLPSSPLGYRYNSVLIGYKTPSTRASTLPQN